MSDATPMHLAAPVRRATGGGVTGIPLIRAAGTAPAIAFLDGIGARVDDLLHRVNLRRETLRDPEALVPLSLCTRFLELAARAEGVANLGALSASDVHISALGTFGRLIGQSLTLREALDTAYRLYPRWASSERYWTTRQGDEVQLHNRFVTSGEEPSAQADWTAVMVRLNLLRSVGGPGWRPTVVGVVARDPAGCRDVPILEGTRIAFGQGSNYVGFSAALLARPLPRTPAVQDAEECSGWGCPDETFGGSLRQFVSSLLGAGYPDVHLVAESVGLSTRTLQRRLGEEGLTYARVVAQARCDLACQRLSDRKQKLIDLALDLGYSDPAHFTRAFRTWTGLSPRTFRRQQRDAGGEP